MTTINPYIGFNGQCEEAMNFYKECLGGGELFFQPVAGSPMEAHCPAAMKGKILHSSLMKGGLLLMGTDMTRPDGYVRGNNMAMSVNCSSEEEIYSFYNNLRVGGEIMDELKKQFWGALFGVVIDKYGICWMLNYDQPV